MPVASILFPLKSYRFGDEKIGFTLASMPRNLTKAPEIQFPRTHRVSKSAVTRYG